MARVKDIVQNSLRKHQNIMFKNCENSNKFSSLKHFLFVPAFIIGSITTCIHTPEEHQPDLDPPPGMIAVSARGHSINQGASDQFSQADERPAFKSIFAHDFCIDTTEVTIAEFQRVTGKIPVQYDSASNYAPQWPVSFVTWYDAALYCNRRSLMDGFDTVYSYSSIDSTRMGNVYRLRGLTIDLKARGYRFPTEAEWEFAAHAGESSRYIWGNDPDTALALQYAWCIVNSDETPHPVAQREKNRFGLYDMAGNVMEWVNDIKGYYPSAAATDYLGAAVSPEDYRPIKGGSFHHSIDKLRISNRCDNYETLSSTSASYIGFRCAFGPVDNGVFSINGKTSENVPPVRMITPDVKPIVSTRVAKLVFVNHDRDRRYLCHVDFSLPDPVVRQYLDSTDVFNPTISPDGRWVAYSTRDEGARDKSAIYIRELTTKESSVVILPDEPAFNPRWWIDTAANDTFIIYTNSAVINDDPSWAGDQTKMMKLSAGTPVGSPITIESAGGYHDGRSKDGRYLATGYNTLRMKNLESGESRVLFTGPGNGKNTGDTSQVCNVSMSPSTADPAEVMLLDFGYPSAGSVTQRPYAVHEYIFTCTFDNQVTRWFAAPPGYVWSHPEWSNASNYAATGLEVSDGTHPSIGILNLKVGLYTQIAEGTDLLYPYLWIGNPDGTQTTDLALDSVGYYNEPPTISTQAELSWKLSLFWKYYGEIEVYFVGSSHIINGVCPVDITKHRALNMGAGGADLQTSLQLIRNYILNQGTATRLIGLEILVGCMDEINGDWSWSTGIANSRGYLYDRDHAFWPDLLPEGFTHYVAQAPNYPPLTPDSIGGFYACSPAVGWGEPVAPVRPGSWTVDLPSCRNSLNTIDSLARILSYKNIHLLCMITPQSPHYRELGYFGKYGATLTTGTDIIKSLQAMEENNKYFHLYDAHQYGLHDYSDIDAANSDHLSETGAHKFSRRLDSLINEILD